VQLRIENGCCFAYTGDFKTGDGITTKGAEQAQCDTLLMESTYGKPQYVFPTRDDVHGSIAGWVSENYAAGRIVLLGGYALGKAQELVALLNEYCGIAPLVGERIERGCCVYGRFGVHLERIALGSSEADEALKRNFVAVVPQHLANTTLAQKLGEAHGREVLCATASGWALGGCAGAHRAFPLSDHADFSELLQYAEQSGAKRVYTCHGFAEELAHELRRRGFNASPVGEAQSTLGEF
jgi:putative mRNA 3-end processing factor